MESKRKRLTALAIAGCLVLMIAPRVLAVSSKGLVERADKLDGQRITYRGEVIGDVMRRGRRAVVNVSDGTYAVGVWLDIHDAREIRYAGRSGVSGDIVEVRGLFHQACLQHGGDLDVHAERLRVISDGRIIRTGFHHTRAALAALLLCVAAVLVLWERRRRRAPLPDGSC